MPGLLTKYWNGNYSSRAASSSAVGASTLPSSALLGKSQSTALQTLKCRKHLLSIAIAVSRVQIDSPSHELDEVRVKSPAESLMTGERPFKWPLRPAAGSQSPDDQSEREDVGAKGGAPHRLFGCHVAYGSGATALNRSLGDLGDAKVSEADVIARKQDHILRLDVAVDHIL